MRVLCGYAFLRRLSRLLSIESVRAASRVQLRDRTAYFWDLSAHLEAGGRRRLSPEVSFAWPFPSTSLLTRGKVGEMTCATYNSDDAAPQSPSSDAQMHISSLRSWPLRYRCRLASKPHPHPHLGHMPAHRRGSCSGRGGASPSFVSSIGCDAFAGAGATRPF